MGKMVLAAAEPKIPRRRLAHIVVVFAFSSSDALITRLLKISGK